MYRRHHSDSQIETPNGIVNTIPIRKLYVAPIKPNISDKIGTYFQTFGEVESVKLHKKDEFQYGFVQFKSVESAQAVLSQKTWHRIENTSFKVKAADSWHQPGPEKTPHPLLVAPAQDSPLHILNAINDDCLRHIFQFFTVKDLSVAAEVCVRFNIHATEAFEKKHLNLDLSGEWCSHGFSSIYEFTILFRNFGKMLQSLKVHMADYLLDLINQHCSSELKQLTLREFDLTGKSKRNMKFYPHLDKLELIDCDIGNSFRTVLRKCHELRTLRLEKCSIYGSKGNMISQKFAKLDTVSLVDCDWLTNIEFTKFVTLNKTLSHLTLKCNNLNASTAAHSIGMNLRDLQHLELDEDTGDSAFQKHIALLASLRQLTVMKLDFSMADVNPLISVLVANDSKIEHLEIRNGFICDQAIGNISKLIQIKILKLIDNEVSLTDEHVIELAKGLPLLEELHLEDGGDSTFNTIGLKKMLPFATKLSLLDLHFCDNIFIDVDDFKVLLKILRDRPEKTKLAIELTGHGDTVSVPEEILAEHRDILTIDEHYDDKYSMGSSDIFDWLDEDDDDWYGYDDDDYDMFDDDSEGGYIDGRLFYLG